MRKFSWAVKVSLAYRFLRVEYSCLCACFVVLSCEVQRKNLKGREHGQCESMKPHSPARLSIREKERERVRQRHTETETKTELGRQRLTKARQIKRYREPKKPHSPARLPIREREKERESQTETERDTQRVRQTETGRGEADRETQRAEDERLRRETERHRQRHTQTEIETHRETTQRETENVEMGRG